MNKEIITLLSEKISDPAFEAAVVSCKSLEELTELLSMHNIMLSEAEIMAIIESGEGELSEDQLEEVAGGLFKKKYKCDDCDEEFLSKLGCFIHLLTTGHWASEK